MANYNLVIIRPKGFLHSSAFMEIRDSLAWSLSSLGHQTMCTENAFAMPPGINIIFGAELLTHDHPMPQHAIIYNLEQPSHPAMANVRTLAKSSGAQVWDYNSQNVEGWRKEGIKAQHLPIGYTPNLTRIPKSDPQDIDVFFAGWMTPRRSKLIQDLRAAGLKVVATDSCYGGGRDELISRSKICLNVNHDGRDLFNIARCSFLFANRKLVLSETSSGCEPWEIQCCAWAEYDNLIHTCQALLAEDSESATIRTVQEDTAFQIFSQQDFTASVEKVLQGGNHAIPPALSGNTTVPGGAPSRAIQNRYECGCQSGDMKDFLPLLRGLAKGQILEIGVRDGASTSAFLLGLEERGGHLTSVDINDCSGLWTHPQWRILCQDSKRCVFPAGSFDLALVDGDHSPDGFLADLTLCLGWVRPGGMILCHDIAPIPNYTQEARGGDWPSEFVGEYFWKFAREHKLRAFVYPGAWGMGVMVKDSQ